MLHQQRLNLIRAAMPHFNQIFERCHTRNTLRNPRQRLQIAQTTWTFLDVRLQVVGGIAKTTMPRPQLLQLRRVIFVARPNQSGRDCITQLFNRFVRRRQRSRIHQRRHHRDVFRSRMRRLRCIANGMPCP